MKVFTNFTSFTSPIQSPKVPVVDFVAWMHLQVLQVPSKVPNACLWFCSMSLFTSFTSQSKMSQMACLWFCSMSSFTRFYKSVSYHLSPLQSQDLIDPKKNCLMEMILLQNQEPEFYIWFLFTKSKTHTCWAKRVSGELSFTESNSFPLTISKPLQNQDLKIWH